MSIIESGILNTDMNSGHEWSFDDSGVLTVTGVGGDLFFDDQCPWAEYADQIEKIIYKGDIDYIYGNMTDFRNLKEVDYDCTVHAILQRYGHEPVELNHVPVYAPVQKAVFGEYVREIGPEAFAFCSGLTDIDTPEIGNMRIGRSAFTECKGLKEVNLNNGVISVGNFAFAECTHLEKVSFPDTIKNIYTDSGMFFHDNALKDLTVAEDCNLTSEAPFPQNISGTVNAPVCLKGIDNDLEKKKITYAVPDGCRVTYGKTEHTKDLKDYPERVFNVDVQVNFYRSSDPYISKLRRDCGMGDKPLEKISLSYNSATALMNKTQERLNAAKEHWLSEDSFKTEFTLTMTVNGREWNFPPDADKSGPLQVVIKKGDTADFDFRKAVKEYIDSSIDHSLSVADMSSEQLIYNRQVKDIGEFFLTSMGKSSGIPAPGEKEILEALFDKTLEDKDYSRLGKVTIVVGKPGKQRDEAVNEVVKNQNGFQLNRTTTDYYKKNDDTYDVVSSERYNQLAEHNMFLSSEHIGKFRYGIERGSLCDAVIQIPNVVIAVPDKKTAEYIREGMYPAKTDIVETASLLYECEPQRTNLHDAVEAHQKLVRPPKQVNKNTVQEL